MSDTLGEACDVCGRPQTRSLYQQGCAAGGAYLDCESDEKAYASLDCLHSAALARVENAEAERDEAQRLAGVLRCVVRQRARTTREGTESAWGIELEAACLAVPKEWEP